MVTGEEVAGEAGVRRAFEQGRKEARQWIERWDREYDRQQAELQEEE